MVAFVYRTVSTSCFYLLLKQSPNIFLSFLLRRWSPVVMRGAYQADAGEKENGTQHAVHHQAFDLPFGTAGLHKDDGKIDEPGNTEQGKDDSKNTLYVHTNALPVWLQMACQQ